jgi:hypothetical protein
MRTDKKGNISEMVDSLLGVIYDLEVVDRIQEINEDIKESDWYAVFFDNEFVSADLRDAMNIVMKVDPDIDYFIFMEKDGDKIYQSPRMFKSHVMLNEDSLMPMQDGHEDLKFERLLDGWVMKSV